MKNGEHEVGEPVSRRGITVSQTYRPQRFEVPTVELAVSSDRQDSARIRLRVDLPASLDIEEVGFHPEYHGEAWAVEDGSLAFETEVRPGEEVTTLYAVESLDPERLDALSDALSIDRVAGEGSGREDQADSEDRAVELIAAERTDDAGSMATDSQESGSTIRGTDPLVADGEDDETARHTPVAERSGNDAFDIPPLSVFPTAELVSELARRFDAENGGDRRSRSGTGPFDLRSGDGEAMDEWTRVIESRLAALEDRVDSVADEQESLAADVSELSEVQDKVTNTLRSLGGH